MAKSKNNRKDPTCYFICDNCGAIKTAPTSDVKLVGHPVCPDECGNEEMTEVTYREYQKAKHKIETIPVRTTERKGIMCDFVTLELDQSCESPKQAALLIKRALVKQRDTTSDVYERTCSSVLIRVKESDERPKGVARSDRSDQRRGRRDERHQRR